jgi:hypothetical protein
VSPLALMSTLVGSHSCATSHAQQQSQELDTGSKYYPESDYTYAPTSVPLRFPLLRDSYSCIMFHFFRDVNKLTTNSKYFMNCSMNSVALVVHKLTRKSNRNLTFVSADEHI